MDPLDVSAAAPRVVPVDLRDHVAFSEVAATRVRVMATDRLALDLWCLEPQQATPVLQDEERDVTYTVLGGRSWFVTDEGEVGLDPLGALLVPAGTAHGIDNRAPDPLVVVAVSAPPGEDPGAAPRPARPGPAVRDDPEPGGLRRAFGRLLGVRDDPGPGTRPGGARP